MKKPIQKIYIGLIFLILYAPILVVVLFSFNEAGNLHNFTGFSLRWYRELFRDDVALTSLRNSLILAAASSVIATVIGTVSAYYIARNGKRRLSAVMESVSDIPMMNPDIVTGVSMMLLFVGVGTLFGFSDSPLGFWTMLIAHTTFNLPYVILSVLPKFRNMDVSISEAALDLGCTPARTFFLVEIPTVLPGILSGLMMSFALSLDDFVISHFVSSPDFQTLPLYVYNQTIHDVKFSMYALCTLMIAVILILLIAVNLSGSVGDRRKSGKK